MQKRVLNTQRATHSSQHATHNTQHTKKNVYAPLCMRLCAFAHAQCTLSACEQLLMRNAHSRGTVAGLPKAVIYIYIYIHIRHGPLGPNGASPMAMRVYMHTCGAVAHPLGCIRGWTTPGSNLSSASTSSRMNFRRWKMPTPTKNRFSEKHQKNNRIHQLFNYALRVWHYLLVSWC